MEIINHKEVLTLIKKYFPHFIGNASNLKIQSSDNSIYITRRKNNSIIEEDILKELIQFEDIRFPLTLYHYRKSEYLEDINNGITRIDSLNKYLDNGDQNELSTGINIFNEKLNDADFDFHSFKGDHYIFCLTDKPKSKYHFKEFGNTCIEFKFTPKVNSSLIKFCKVKYLEELTNFIELQETLQSRYGLKLKLKSGATISPFVKANDYKPEREFRILFNVYIEELLKHLAIDSDELNFLHELKRYPNYIEIPLDNTLFKLSVVNIWHE